MTIEITDEGNVTITNMIMQCHRIHGAIGNVGGYAERAYSSLAVVQSQMFNLGGRIWKDGELSLMGQTQTGLVYGVTFSPVYSMDEFDENDIAFIKASNAYPGTWSVNT